jgi:TRAP-type C4-dicarboxylate transport system substrate-binding protein
MASTSHVAMPHLLIFSKTIWQNLLKFGRKHLWKVLYKVSSKQNDRSATKAEHTEPLVFIHANFVPAKWFQRRRFFRN